MNAFEFEFLSLTVSVYLFVVTTFLLITIMKPLNSILILWRTTYTLMDFVLLC
jgi:hypothetical protein